ncbi:hypothetical protein L6164_001178 [Bauhinia variegata]|uniref:Uncharacterized protein n=1 Tax=Bauhinia variegata TaxID=167791 RepID=A0ACB9QFA5_BAUVA|nr:hypothetical protein L6164_001178 [Bauhinia variegata]
MNHYLSFSLYKYLYVFYLQFLKSTATTRHTFFITVSQKSMESLDFRFPAVVNTATPNDIVFCGKVMVRQTEPAPPPKDPFQSRSESFGRLIIGQTSSEPNSGQDRRSDSLRSYSAVENRCSRSSSTRKRYSGLFGILRFPLQMELSDIKNRQGKMEPATLPAFPGDGDRELASGGGGRSCWELVRPLKRRNHLMAFLAKTSFGCIPVV